MVNQEAGKQLQEVHLQEAVGLRVRHARCNRLEQRFREEPNKIRVKYLNEFTLVGRLKST